MKKVFLLLALLPLDLCAQQPVERIQAADLKADIVFLSSDEMAGRLTGSNEARIAANYAASEFSRLGLKPLGDGGTFFQNFDLTKSGPDNSAYSLAAHFPKADKSYEVGRDFYAYDIQSNTPAMARGPVVFCGYGVDAPEYGYTDFAGVDVRGKIALILGHEPQEFDEHSKFKGKWNTLHAYIEYKYEALKKAGAAGVLVVEANDAYLSTDRPSAPHNWDFPQPSYGLAGAFFDLPIEVVSESVADELLAASGKTVASLRESIDKKFRPQSFEIPGVTVTIGKNPKNPEIVHGRNVIAMIEGSDPALAKQYLILSAHYDHVGVVQGHVYHGADDNASGVAAVLESARAYALGGVKPKRSVIFLLFDSEEEGMYGAFYYASNPVVPLAGTVAMLNADMIGRDEDTSAWPNIAATSHNSVNIVGTLYDPDVRKVIESDNRAVGLDLDFKTDTSDPQQWFVRSDQFAFAARSVPIAFFNTGEHPDYHTENDTWDRINYLKLEKIARLMFLTSVDLANAKARPRFVP